MLDVESSTRFQQNYVHADILRDILTRFQSIQELNLFLITG